MAAAEDEIMELVDSGEFERATETVIDAYGSELYNYIRKLCGDPHLADDAFQSFSIDLWEGLESFEGRSSIETWAYTVARNAAYQLMRKQGRKKERPLYTDEQRRLAERWTRSATKNWEKTEAKHWLWEIVEEFGSEARELFVLRIGNQKSWREIAEIVEDDDLEGKELSRASARLRKRYQRLKEKLRKRRDEFDESEMRAASSEE